MPQLKEDRIHCRRRLSETKIRDQLSSRYPNLIVGEPITNDEELEQILL